jgi:integrase/recombinase XerD
VAHLRKRMLEELQRRNYSEGTTRAYLHAVEQFAVHFGKSPDKLGPDDLRSYQAYLLAERKLAVGSVVARVAALRFFSFAHSSDLTSGKSCPIRNPIADCRPC